MSRSAKQAIVLGAVTLLASILPLPHVASAASAGGLLVLPLRSVGVSDTTAFVSWRLLTDDLRDLGVELAPVGGGEPGIGASAEACDQAECAVRQAREAGAWRVAYGSVSRLGGKIIARMSVLRVGEDEAYYRDQLTATSEDDLDAVMRRFAEGIAAGRPNSDRATVESVTRAETFAPALRATRSGMGLRAGFLFPTDGGFGGSTRLTNLRATYKYELPSFFVETTTLTGFTFGDGNFDWTLLDIGAARIFGRGDVSPYLGASVGVHTVTVERRETVTTSYPGGPTYTYEQGRSQTETAPTLDVIFGVMGLRTYDFELVAELRYHHVFEAYDRVGGGGAHGVMLTIGTAK